MQEESVLKTRVSPSPVHGNIFLGRSWKDWAPQESSKICKIFHYIGIFLMSSRKYQDSFALEQLKEI